ncbi:MFS transporter [Mesorhizobium sp. IMUNJ 23232]|uniref:MFS transporter n=1 Tax=Mesorhizobium sp. IMUNJ 23232 TaxID=3376064 RepID=UPI0037A067E5
MPLPSLSPEQLIKPKNFEFRISLIFAAIFVPQAVHLPYFPLWLEGNGFGAEEIAVILSAPMFLRVVTTPFITAMADQASDRANVLILLVAAALLVSLGFFLKPTYLVVLVVSLALAVAWTPHSPLSDSLALSGVRRFGSNYTRMRIWGSIAFLCANLGGGIILSLTSEKSVPAIISCSLVVALLVSFMAPRLGRPRKASPLSAAEIQDAGPKLLNHYFVLVVGSAGVINGSHAFLYSFVSIYWKSIGIGDTTVGLLWAWAVVAEAFMFLFFTRLFSRHSATAVMALAGVGAVVRWLAFPLIWPSGIGVIGFFAIQSLHSFSTALILIGVQKLIVETVPEERTGAAQGIAFFATGFSMAAFTLLSGPLYAAFGVFGFWAMIAVAVVGLVLVWMARPLRSS